MPGNGGSGGSGPPDKFPVFIDLSNEPTYGAKAVALGTAYQEFYKTYGVWPTVAVSVGEVVYLGAYGKP
jgi:hypothetical protein